MERGDDFFREDFGGPEDLDAQDIPRIAELDGDAWGDLRRGRPGRHSSSLAPQKKYAFVPRARFGMIACRSSAFARMAPGITYAESLSGPRVGIE